jgi:hypothetical protein
MLVTTNSEMALTIPFQSVYCSLEQLRMHELLFGVAPLEEFGNIGREESLDSIQKVG